VRRPDPTIRHELLAAPLQGLNVLDGTVAESTPRQDREAEVISLMDAVRRLDLAKSGERRAGREV
jgi:hypothetical protein